MLKDKIKKKQLKENTKKNSGHSRLTYQAHNLGHETMIIS